jgi:hypothetical protein
MANKKYNKDLVLVEYNIIIMWLNRHNATRQNPMSIEKGRKSTLPFRAHVENGNIIIRSNPQAKTYAEYVMTHEMWQSFCNYVRANPNMSRGDMAENYHEYGCIDKTCWPAPIHICNAYNNN